MLLGRKDLIAAAVPNNSPNSDSVGRGMKVAKEQIVGMVAALDWFVSQSDAAMEAEFRRRARPDCGATEGSAHSRIECPSSPIRPPTLFRTSCFAMTSSG